MRTGCFHTHAIERLTGMEYLRVKTFQTDSTLTAFAYSPVAYGLKRGG